MEGGGGGRAKLPIPAILICRTYNDVLIRSDPYGIYFHGTKLFFVSKMCSISSNRRISQHDPKKMPPYAAIALSSVF